MAKTMIAPEAATMTDGQIENAVNKLRDAMRKHRSKITSDIAQQVLGVENLGMMMFEPFLACVRGLSNTIIRMVTVDRSRTTREALDATGFVQCANPLIVERMPRAKADEVELVFFKPDLSERNGRMSDSELEEEYKLRGLTPADPCSLAAYNEADPAFVDEYPNATHWQGVQGNWFYATFDYLIGPVVQIDCSHNHGDDWDDNWWFAGIRKSS